MADHWSWNLLILRDVWGEGGLYKQVCDSGEFVGNLWQRGREREGEGGGEGEGEGERGGEGKAEGGRGARRGKERGGRVLWPLGGNLC